MSILRRLLIFIGAFLFAGLLWAYVRLSTPYEADIDLPLSITAPKGLAVASPLPTRLHTRVRGAGWQILLMDFTDNSRFQFDLGNRSVAENTPLILRQDEITHAAMAPSEVRVVNVEPDSLELLFARRTQKRVPIVPRTDIEPGAGYVIVGKPIASPATVIIEGATSVLDSLQSFPTTPIVAHHIHEDIERAVPLSDTLANYISFPHESQITVKVDVQAIGEWSIPSLVVGVDALPPEFDVLLIPNTVTVTLRGGVDLLASLTESGIRVHIPYDPVRFGTQNTLEPTVDLPVETQLLAVDPPRVKYIIRKKPIVINANR